jgi:hypothetical protein
MQALRAKKKTDQSEKLAADMAVWVAEHGEPPLSDHTDTKMWRDRNAKRGPHIPMTVMESQLKHRWRPKGNWASG